MSDHWWKPCQAKYETMLLSKYPPSGNWPCTMMLTRSSSLKPPVCSGVCETSVKGPVVAVSPWQDVQAGPPLGFSSGLPVPDIVPERSRVVPLLYLAFPIAQSDGLA